jgi:hypothetical protein
VLTNGRFNIVSANALNDLQSNAGRFFQASCVQAIP